MYQQKARGHGVCGSLNIYSNNVKLGNWVEDTIAAELIANPTEPYKNYSTNTSLSYIDPKDQPPPPTMNMPSTQELKAKNKEGMPYGLIFDHGMTPVTSEVIDCCCSYLPTLHSIMQSRRVHIEPCPSMYYIGSTDDNEHGSDHEAHPPTRGPRQ